MEAALGATSQTISPRIKACSDSILAPCGGRPQTGTVLPQVRPDSWQLGGSVTRGGIFRPRAPTAHLNHRGHRIQSFLPKKRNVMARNIRGSLQTPGCYLAQLSLKFTHRLPFKSAHMALRGKYHSWTQVCKLLLLLMHTHALLSPQGGAAQSDKA